jgi:hypothetical protein
MIVHPPDCTVHTAALDGVGAGALVTLPPELPAYILHGLDDDIDGKVGGGRVSSHLDSGDQRSLVVIVIVCQRWLRVLYLF